MKRFLFLTFLASCSVQESDSSTSFDQPEATTELDQSVITPRVCGRGCVSDFDCQTDLACGAFTVCTRQIGGSSASCITAKP